MLASTRSVATALASAVLALLFLATGPATFAAEQDWYSKSSPLTATDDETTRAQAFGTAYTKDGYLKNHTFYKDPHGYNRGAYTETVYSYREPTAQYGEQWGAKIGKDQSGRNPDNVWVDQYDANDYSSRQASQGRVHVKTCEDQKLSADPCSRQPYFTFTL